MGGGGGKGFCWGDTGSYRLVQLDLNFSVFLRHLRVVDVVYTALVGLYYT